MLQASATALMPSDAVNAAGSGQLYLIWTVELQDELVLRKLVRSQQSNFWMSWWVGLSQRLSGVTVIRCCISFVSPHSNTLGVHIIQHLLGKRWANLTVIAQLPKKH